MAKRKYKLAELTEEQMVLLEEAYPKAVNTCVTRKLDYRICSMLVDCGAKLPDGVELVENESVAKGDELVKDAPAFLKGKGKGKKLGLAEE